MKKKKKIKVIRVVVGLNQGGVQQMILNLFKGLDKNIFEPIALAIENSGAIGEDIEREGFRVINLGLQRKSLSFIKIIRELQKVFVMEKPFIVHGSSYYPSVYSRVAAKFAGVPILISHEHLLFKTKRPKRQIISHFVSRFTDLHIAVSKSVKEQVVQWYKIPESKVVVVFNGVDTGIFNRRLPIEQAKAKLNIPPDTFVVGYVGRLDPEKGHLHLFKALKKIKGKCKMRCIIVGTGRHENNIKQLAKKCGIYDITDFLGLKRNIPELLSAMDTFVLPSFQEGFSNALIEAMAVGCPVIASDIPGNNEAVNDRENGLLVPSGNSVAIASAIERLQKNEGTCMKITRNARKRVEENFSLKKHIEIMENHYFNLVKKKELL